MRISPQQYFQGYENPPQTLGDNQVNLQPPTQKLQLESTQILCFVLIALVAGAALGIAIASMKK